MTTVTIPAAPMVSEPVAPVLCGICWIRPATCGDECATCFLQGIDEDKRDARRMS